MKRKLFISHASEDKEKFVRPLAEALLIDFDVWYDDYKLRVGVSLLEEINKGLAECDYGVVVLSKHFFAKNWPQQELNGLFSLEEKNKKVILPVWYNIQKDEVAQYSPIMADRLATKSSDGIGTVVSELKRSVAYFERGKSVQMPREGFEKLRSVLQRKAEAERSNKIISSVYGVKIAFETAKQTQELLASKVKSLPDDGSKKIKLIGPKVENVLCYVTVAHHNIHLFAQYENLCGNDASNARLYISLKEINKYKGRDKTIGYQEYVLFVNQNNELLWKIENNNETYTPEDLVDIWLLRFSEAIDRD